MLRYRRKNSGFKYILTVVDCFSRKNWVAALKTKDGDETAAALDKIISSMPEKPRTIATDIGTELINKAVRRVVVEKYGMVEFRLIGKTKATIVERFKYLMFSSKFLIILSRTLGERIQRFFMENNTERWVDDLQNFSKAINNSPNRTTGAKPNEVNSENWHEIYDKLYNGKPYSVGICKFNVGDQVRIPIEIPKSKETFRKGTMAQWSKELYTISKIYRSGPICYFRLKRDSAAVKHVFYEKELNLVIRKR